jgi:hypothetical protein
MQMPPWIVIASSLVMIALAFAAAGCSRHDPASDPPPAPAMPAPWKNVQDQIADRNKLGEFEYRLEGKIKAARTTLYLVDGKRVQLNTIVPRDATEADRIYRILANKRAPRTYLRKNEVLYEFIAAADASGEVDKGYEMLAR